MKNGQSRHNWERLHGEVENYMETPKTAVLKMWWGRLCKRKIRQLFQREKNRVENHLYEFMYDELKRSGTSDKTLPVLNR